MTNSTLYIFDVDDTLIDTRACVRAIDDKGNTIFRAGTKVFNAPGSTEALLGQGMQWDFSEFESLEQMMTEPKLPAFDALRRVYESGANVKIVTARQARGMIAEWLRRNDIPMSQDDIYCYDERSYLPIADWKAGAVYTVCSEDTKKVVLFEDDLNNIKSITRICADNGLEITVNPTQF